MLASPDRESKGAALPLTVSPARTKGPTSHSRVAPNHSEGCSQSDDGSQSAVQVTLLLVVQPEPH